MSRFLHNVVRRGAGLPVTSAQASLRESPVPSISSGDGLVELNSETFPEASNPAAAAEQEATARSSVQTPGTSAVSSLSFPPPAFIQHLVEPLKAGSARVPVVLQRPETPQSSLEGQNALSPTDPATGVEAARSTHGNRITVASEGPTKIEKGVDGSSVVLSVAGTEFARSSEETQLRDEHLTLEMEPPAGPSFVADNHSQKGSTLDSVVLTPTPTIRPRFADTKPGFSIPKAVVSVSSPAPESPLPIHVRIGRVEVRDTPANGQPGRVAPPPLGFANYYRIRNYRGWK